MHELKADLNGLESSLLDAVSGQICRRSDSPDNVRSFEVDGNDVRPQLKMPDIFLLTVAQEPQDHYELCCGVSDFSPVHNWLRHAGKPSLDGVYIQYQPEMLHPEGIAALRDDL